MRFRRAVLSGTLAASAFFGAQIAMSDRFLWVAAPTHAYGLVGFTLFDLALGITLWRKEWLASLLSIFLATTQTLAMLSDLYLYTAPYVPQGAFRSYLLSTMYFIPLLAIQPIIFWFALRNSNLHYDITNIHTWLHGHHLP